MLRPHLTFYECEKMVFFIKNQKLKSQIEKLIPPGSGHCSPPCGFYSEKKQLINRALEQLSEGLKNVNTVVSSVSGMSIPLLGSGNKKRLIFKDGVTFEDCENFLVENNYLSVEFVSNPGEYSLRGGIIDVFPKSSFYPCRVNFLDSPPSIFRFDIDSQLTGGAVENFILKFSKKNEI